MNCIFLPSLQHATIVRIASLLYNDPEIRNMLEEEHIILGWLELEWRKKEDKFHEAWQLVEMKTEEKLFSLLPTILRKQVSKVIHPMHNEVIKWKYDHRFIVESVDVSCCIPICWKMDGTVNRSETACKLVMNENINLEFRFIVACTYFFEEKVLELWGRIAEVDKKNIICKGTNAAVRLWLEWLQKQNIQHWREMIDVFMFHTSNGRIPGIKPLDIPLRVSSFFRFLSLEKKQIYINHINMCFNVMLHSDDFRICFHEMDEIERIKIISARPFDVLRLYLRWPYQNLLNKMMPGIVSGMHPKSFAIFLTCMLNSYLSRTIDNNDILEEYWQISPTDLKNKAKKYNFLLKTVEEVLEKKYISGSLKKIVKNCFLD